MNTYPENYNVIVNVPFVDPAGVTVTPSSVTCSVIGIDGVELVNIGAIAVSAGDTSADIIIPAQYNVVPGDNIRTVITLVATISYPGGNVENRFSYIIEKNVSMVVMKNTFMSYEESVLIARDFVNISGWNVANDASRRIALAEAFSRVTSIPMRHSAGVIRRDDWPNKTQVDFEALPEGFKTVLKRAQFSEANELLQGDSVGNKRRSGIIAETIGESSVKIDQSVIDYGVSSSTLAILTGYILFDMRIERA